MNEEAYRGGGEKSRETEREREGEARIYRLRKTERQRHKSPARQTGVNVTAE